VSVFELPQRHAFPDPRLAEPDGLLAVGGDLDPDRLVQAYARGIFPWPHEGYPMLWFSPDPRWVLSPAEIHISRRLRRSIRQRRFEIRLDSDFEGVIRACADMEREDSGGSWIWPGMIESYCALHRAGFAHSAEAWLGDRLVGGLYGVSIGRVFTGESMFTAIADAPKAAFVTLAAQLERWGFDLLDTQVETPHVLRYGVRPMPRAQYLEILAEPGLPGTRRGPWRLDEDLRWGPAL
jgi:leucyl/phenylalanyl-tRNA--protein transferase